MNEDIRREIEDRIYGHDSIGYQLLNEFLSEEQFQELARETFRKFADVLEKNGILALEAIDRRLDSIIERVTAECSRADTEINELARNAGNIALLEYWKSEWRPKRDQIETSMISYAEKIETLASHRSRLNYTHGYALFRKEVLRAVLHRYALFGAVPASEADIRENGLPGEAWDFLTANQREMALKKHAVHTEYWSRIDGGESRRDFLDEMLEKWDIEEKTLDSYVYPRKQ